MAFEKVDRPYEFLVRWRDGKISGAHVGYETGFIDENGKGEFVPGKVQPVAIGDAKGFPLKTILEAIHIDALAGRDEALEAQKAAEQSSTEAQAKVTEMLAAVDAALGQLNTQVESLNAVKAKFAPVQSVDAVAAKVP